MPYQNIKGRPSAYNMAGAAVSAFNTGRKVYSKYKAPPKKVRKVVIKSRAVRAKTYTKSKSKSSSSTHGGYDNQSVAYKHGFPQKIPMAFKTKVRDAISAINTFPLVGTSKWVVSSSQGAYFASPSLYFFNDLARICALFNSTTSTQSATKYTILDSVIRCTLTNATNLQAHVRVYECQARRDVPLVLQYPVAMLTQGFTDAGHTGFNTDLSSTAFSSPLFCSWYKILNVKNLKFNPGEEKTLTLTDRSPFLINMDRYFYGTTSTAQVLMPGKRGRFLLFQVWSQVAAEAANLAHIGTGVSTINCVWTQRYNYTWTNDYNNTIASEGQANCMDNSSGVLSTLSNPDVIQELTGATSAEAEA